MCQKQTRSSDFLHFKSSACKCFGSSANRCSNCQVKSKATLHSRTGSCSETSHGVKRADEASNRLPPKGVVTKQLFEPHAHRAISKYHSQEPIQLPLLRTAPVSNRPSWSPSSLADSCRVVDDHHPAGTGATQWPAIGTPNCVGHESGHVWSLKWCSG